jgi:hypothetical protein
MPIEIACPACETVHRFPVTAAGKRVLCKSCRKPFLVESAEDADESQAEEKPAQTTPLKKKKKRQPVADKSNSQFGKVVAIVFAVFSLLGVSIKLWLIIAKDEPSNLAVKQNPAALANVPTDPMEILNRMLSQSDVFLNFMESERRSGLLSNYEFQRTGPGKADNMSRVRFGQPIEYGVAVVTNQTFRVIPLRVFGGPMAQLPQNGSFDLIGEIIPPGTPMCFVKQVEGNWIRISNIINKR